VTNSRWDHLHFKGGASFEKRNSLIVALVDLVPGFSFKGEDVSSKNHRMTRFLLERTRDEYIRECDAQKILNWARSQSFRDVADFDMKFSKSSFVRN
jgi:hypothetical protein